MGNICTLCKRPNYKDTNDCEQQQYREDNQFREASSHKKQRSLNLNAAQFPLTEAEKYTIFFNEEPKLHQQSSSQQSVSPVKIDSLVVTPTPS